MAPHAEAVPDLLARLDASVSGLPEEEAGRRRPRFGPNRLERAKPVPALTILLHQLRSIVVVLLVAAALVSFALGERVEAAAIAVVLAINTAIGFVTELRARRAMAALLRLDVPRAFVVRQGDVRAVAAELLVPGDVIALDAGQQVPADARLMEQTDLRTDEAALTGESLPVSKGVTVLPAETPLADRVNMVYKGTTVVAGTGRAVVTGTGRETELGRIGVLAGSVQEERAPLERRLDELGHRLVWLALGVAALVATLGAAQGAPPSLVVELGIALAVAAVPEALPAVATIALAVGVRRMAHRRALVRRLPAVEALGSTTVICTDKTRTLTSGDMTAVRLWAAGRDVDLTNRRAAGEPAVRRALEVAVLASREQAAGAAVDSPAIDPVDAALIRTARELGVDRAALTGRHPGVAVVPFSSRRKLMASFHAVDSRLTAFVKGAPQQIVPLAARLPDGATVDEDGRRALLQVNERLALAGLRVLALASGPVATATADDLVDLTFEGFVGLMDPPAPGVRETIARLRDAGLRTVMLTGDQRLTAQAVGCDLGVLTRDHDVIGGVELDTLSREELEARVGRVGAFSRISPEHKLAIVTALQARGEIVAMLGDGINDAAALRKADVGVAMGRRGTDVAKEAASIVLQDDRFETIAVAVEEGRVIFDNIRKFVFYLFSCNVAEVLVLLVAGLAGLPLPLLPMQLLWLNMVTDTFPALALAMEPAEADVMRRPPRNPRDAILSARFLGGILLYGGFITGSALAAFLWALRAAPEQAVSAAFMTLALAQTLHLGNARSAEAVVRPRRVGANAYALGAVALSIGLQLAAMYVEPLSLVLRVQPLDAAAWAVVVGLSIVPAAAGQLLKLAGVRL